MNKESRLEGGFEICKRRESRTCQSSFARNYSDESVGVVVVAGHEEGALPTLAVVGEGRVAFPSVMELR